MNFKIVVVLALVGLTRSENAVENKREGKFINFKMKAAEGSEAFRKLGKLDADDSKISEDYAGDALSGIYVDCLSQVSFSCVQKKVLSFINRMNRMEKFSLLGNYVSVVRTKNEFEQEPEFQARLNTAEENSQLDELMDNAIDRFLNSHIFRVKVPNTFAVAKPSESRAYEPTTSLDFRFPYSDGTEARKKGGGGKMGKKMMMMMMMGLKAKFMMLGPLILGMAGLMAIKALIASVISLTISKIMIIKKLMKNKGAGGHGGGWDSSGSGGGGGWASGGGGWDRRSIYERNQDNSWDASDLAYRAYSTVENLF